MVQKNYTWYKKNTSYIQRYNNDKYIDSVGTYQFIRNVWHMRKMHNTRK